jgi:hypothetical protein
MCAIGASICHSIFHTYMCRASMKFGPIATSAFGPFLPCHETLREQECQEPKSPQMPRKHRNGVFATASFHREPPD